MAGKLLALGWLAFLSACTIDTTLLGSGDAGDAGGDAAVYDASPDASTGESCDIPTASGIMLCSTTKLCPKVSVSPVIWEGCGFLPNGNQIALQCECGGYLCPAPQTSTCMALSALLSTMNFNDVCAQLMDDTGGACTNELLGDLPASP